MFTHGGRICMNKKLILVTSPPACGKTYVAKALAKQLQQLQQDIPGLKS